MLKYTFAHEFGNMLKLIDNVDITEIFKTLPGLFYWMDRDGRIVLCNDNEAAVFGLTRSEAIGKNIYDFAEILGWDRAIADKIRQNDLKVMESDKEIMVEEEVLIKGVKRTYLSYKYPLKDKSNELIGVLGVSVDITERKQVERELLKEKLLTTELAKHAKSQFLMNMSHDIRSPFSGIIGNAQLLYRQETSESKREILHQIIESSKNLLDLMNNVINAAELGTDVTLGYENFNIHERVHKIASSFNYEATRKNLYLSIEIDDNVPTHIVTNPNNVEKILLNFLGNAVKFTHDGGVKIIVNNETADGLQKKLAITIVDTGIGIDNDKFGVIFEKFTRLYPAFERQYPGNGLGLWLAAQLMDQIDAEVSIESEIGKGTAITFSFMYEVSDQKALVNEDNLIMDNGVSQVKNILVVEDDLVASKMADMVLSEYYQATVDLASTGGEALNLAKQKKYDFILMDIGLPDMDGLNVAKVIRDEIDIQANTPIIGLTAHGSIKFEHDVITSVLTKPLTYELCEKISGILPSA